jgi:hypothetical protein
MSNFDRIERPNHEIRVSVFKDKEEEKRLSKANEISHNKSESTVHTSGFQSIVINNQITSKSVNYDKEIPKINLSAVNLQIIDEEEGMNAKANSFQVENKFNKSRMNDFDDSQSLKSQFMLSSLALNMDMDGFLVNVKRSKR